MPVVILQLIPDHFRDNKVSEYPECVPNIVLTKIAIAIVVERIQR